MTSHAPLRLAAASAVVGLDDEIDWGRVAGELDAFGTATIENLLLPDQCRSLISLYDNDKLFRSKVVMQRYNFGSGEYRYFRYPLPEIVSKLRSAVYPKLVPVANRWAAQLGAGVQYPVELADFLTRCHHDGQMRPAPLLLKYGSGDYNCLHQDVYGAHSFPIQLAILLSEPGVDFVGGEFVITEQRPRMQSRPDVISLSRGDAVIFANRNRPVQGKRGAYGVNLRHGVSRVRAGERFALGVIFHDAE